MTKLLNPDAKDETEMLERTLSKLNGRRNLITTKEVKIANVLVPFSSVTVVNDTLIRFVVPKIFTGEVNIYTQIGITTDYGSFSGGTLFNYNPSLSGTSMTSPGSITNPEAANTPVASTTATTATTTTNVTNVAPGVNTNPQNTGPKTLIIVTDSSLWIELSPLNILLFIFILSLRYE